MFSRFSSFKAIGPLSSRDCSFKYDVSIPVLHILPHTLKHTFTLSHTHTLYFSLHFFLSFSLSTHHTCLILSPFFLFPLYSLSTPFVSLSFSSLPSLLPTHCQHCPVSRLFILFINCFISSFFSPPILLVSIFTFDEGLSSSPDTLAAESRFPRAALCVLLLSPRVQTFATLGFIGA